MNLNWKQSLWAAFCLGLYIAIPIGFWSLMGPDSFWERLVMIVLIITYIIWGGLGGALLFLFGADALEEY